MSSDILRSSNRMTSKRRTPVIHPSAKAEQRHRRHARRRQVEFLTFAFVIALLVIASITLIYLFFGTDQSFRPIDRVSTMTEQAY